MKTLHLLVFPLALLACLALSGIARADIAQRGSPTSASITSGTNLTINKPTGVVFGDLMIVAIANYASTSGVATSSGWTLIRSGTLGTGSSSRWGNLLYKTAGASEPGNYTFVLPGTVGGAVGGILAFSGVDVVSPLDVASPALTTATTATVTAASITTVTGSAAAIMFGLGATTVSGSGGTWSSWTTASGAPTEILDIQGSGTTTNATTVGAAWKLMPVAGATGTGTATLSSAMRQAGIWVALKPATPAANAANSSLSASPTNTYADGASSSTVTVTLKDASNLPVAGRSVSLLSSRGATDTITPASGTSNASGVVAFTVTSLTVGSPVFTGTDTTDAVGITQTASVNFSLSPAKDFLSFGTNLIGSSAVIDTGAATVNWIVPAGTLVLSLSPNYTLPAKASASPSSGTIFDFTNPQTYTITAQDGSTKVYTVSVTVAAPSSAKEILSFGPGATISGTTITWNLPVGTNARSLSPTYTASALATGSPLSGSTQDFSSPKTYTITAQDGSTKTYLVTVVVATGAQSYAIALSTDVAQEFSPKNLSGHPVVTGLDNYTNSTAVGGKRGLLAAAMKAPWNTNVGQQTMMCTDCHNSDAATPAAQGPHGSASQFMLRGPNAANWPAVTLSNFNTSWCANCHNNSTQDWHAKSNHLSQYCYACHIVVPHGGKLSRLIADRDSSMPSRYAYNNDLTTVQVLCFTKAATTGYNSDNNSCRVMCGHHSSTPSATMENW